MRNQSTLSYLCADSYGNLHVFFLPKYILEQKVLFELVLTQRSREIKLPGVFALVWSGKLTKDSEDRYFKCCSKGRGFEELFCASFVIHTPTGGSSATYIRCAIDPLNRRPFKKTTLIITYRSVGKYYSCLSYWLFHQSIWYKLNQ